jgi:hypothetical protein
MIGLFLGIIASLVYIYPVFSGLILLPLDLLVSNSAPWFLANQILIKNSYMLDSIIQIYPWHHLTFISLIKGIIPLWNPYQLTGLPFMASMKPMVFYPLNILFGFGEVSSWNALLFFQLFLAFYFTFVLMRSFKVSIWGSILSSIAFAFSSLMIGFLQFGSDGHALIWLPFLFYCLYRFIESKRILFLFGLSFGFAIGIFAGHLQMTSYQFGVLMFFTLYSFLNKSITIQEVGKIILALFLGGGLSAVQMIPSLELFSQSFRSLGDMSAQFAGGLIRPHEFLRIFSPDLFGHPATKDLHVGYIETGAYYGLIPLFFTLFAFTKWKKQFLVKFFVVVCVLATLFAMWPIGILISILKIPVISSGSGGRLFSIALFCGAVLSGFGLDYILKNGDWKKFFRMVMVYTIGVLIFFVVSFFINLKITNFGGTLTNLKFCTLIAIGFFSLSFLQMVFVKKGKIVTWTFLTILLLASYFDVFRMGYRFLTFSNSKFMYPNIPVIQYVREKIQPTLSRVYGLSGSEVPTYLGIASIETYNSLYPVRSAKVLRALEGVELSMEPNNTFRFEYSDRMKYVLDVLGVAYIVTENDKNPSISYFRSSMFEKDLTKIYSDEGHDVYINHTAYPRFGLYYQIKSGLHENEILNDIKNKVSNLRTTVLLEESLTEPLETGTGSAILLDSDVNSQKFSIDTNTRALFYVSDAYFPGWKVYIDGKETHVYRANYNFRAVLVPEGKSQVVFKYDPFSYRFGKYVSVGSFLFLILFGGVSIFQQNKLKKKEK